MYKCVFVGRFCEFQSLYVSVCGRVCGCELPIAKTFLIFKITSHQLRNNELNYQMFGNFVIILLINLPLPLPRLPPPPHPTAHGGGQEAGKRNRWDEKLDDKKSGQHAELEQLGFFVSV